MILKINIRNGFFYVGPVLSETEDFITLLDKRNREVSINKYDIVTKEVIEE